MASKGYSYSYNGAWIFASDDNPHAWHSTPWNFLPRVGLNYDVGRRLGRSRSPMRAS